MKIVGGLSRLHIFVVEIFVVGIFIVAYFEKVIYNSTCSPFGAMAQLVAHLHGMEGVEGSNPSSSTSKGSGY